MTIIKQGNYKTSLDFCKKAIELDLETYELTDNPEVVAITSNIEEGLGWDFVNCGGRLAICVY